MIDNRFEIRSTISSDGQSSYCHVQDYLDCDFVMKIFNPQAFASSHEAMQTLEKEQKLSMLFEGHPNILQNFGGSAKGELAQGDSKGIIMYSVNEYCSSNPVSRMIESQGPFCVEFALKVFKQMLSALDFLHERNYAHLNLCLDNICLDQNLNAKLAKAEQAQYSDCCESEVALKTGVSYYKAPEMDEEFDDLYDPLLVDVYSLAI